MTLLLLGPLVFFGLLEVGLRIGGFSYDPGAVLLEGKSHSELGQSELYVPHPELIWTLRPSSILDLPAAGFCEVRTNSRLL